MQCVPLFCLVWVKSLPFCHQLMIDSVGFDGADVRGIELVSEDVRLTRPSLVALKVTRVCIIQQGLSYSQT